MEPEKHFWHRLESLRGIFALTVAVHHSFCMIQTDESAGRITRGILGIFYGHGAVISFFILSGLVLGQSLRRCQRGIDYLIFYIRRLLRIYPALITSLILSSLLLVVFNFWKFPSQAATPYYENFYEFSFSFSRFFQNLFLVNFDLNNVTWTLWVEIIGSLFLPIFHLLSRKPIHRFLLMLCLFALQAGVIQNAFNGAVQYFWIFYLGYLIPLYPKKMWEYLKEKKLLIFLLMVAVAICWFTPHFGHHVSLYAPSACFFIATVFQLPKEQFFSFLDNNLVKFYGRISYSFYVMHFIVLYFVTGFIFEMFHFNFLIGHSIEMSIFLTFLSVGIATPISFICYQCIEKPFIRLGQKLATSLK
jgi:peptidoglycan/LPS O-acetylase OafA/YrhL